MGYTTLDDLFYLLSDEIELVVVLNDEIVGRYDKHNSVDEEYLDYPVAWICKGDNGGLEIKIVPEGTCI